MKLFYNTQKVYDKSIQISEGLLRQRGKGRYTEVEFANRDKTTRGLLPAGFVLNHNDWNSRSEDLIRKPFAILGNNLFFTLKDGREIDYLSKIDLSNPTKKLGFQYIDTSQYGFVELLDSKSSDNSKGICFLISKYTKAMSNPSEGLFDLTKLDLQTDYSKSNSFIPFKQDDLSDNFVQDKKTGFYMRRIDVSNVDELKEEIDNKQIFSPVDLANNMKTIKGYNIPSSVLYDANGIVMDIVPR